MLRAPDEQWPLGHPRLRDRGGARGGLRGLVLGVILAVSAAACGTARSASRAELPPARFGRAAPDLDDRRPIHLWATHYSVRLARDAGASGVPLLDLRGRALGPRLTPRDFCHAALEGTVRVAQADGSASTYLFAGLSERPLVDCTRFGASLVTNGRARFLSSPNPLGTAANGAALVPFRSIAADPRVLPPGTVLFIPSARGVTVTLPSGEEVVHDGYFYVADRGAEVHGNHIDVFLGVAVKSPFPFVKGSARDTFPAYVVPGP